MLKYSKIQLEHLHDAKINDFYINFIRGGVCVVKKRYVNGEVKFTNKETQNIIKYLDATNLYGSVMLQKLTYKNFRLLSEKELAELEKKLKSHEYIDVEGEPSYFIEVDLPYPSHIHKFHHQWPLAPETYNVSFDNFSLFSKIQLYCSQPSNSHKVVFSEPKLIPHFYKRKNYRLHITDLIYYLKKGLVLEKNHILYFQLSNTFVRQILHNVLVFQ